jgi:hypothetical protein
MLIAASPAVAAQNCVDAVSYYAKGGKLTHATKLVGSYVSQPGFTCDRPPCFGAVDFAGVVDQKGGVGNLRVTRNTWEVQPAEHAKAIQLDLAAWRYVPPKLAGKPVCVKMGWHIVVKPSNETAKP